MRRKGGLDDEKQIDLKDGESAASGVLVRANEAIDREQRLEAVGELLSRVEDWKGHNIDHFGELMLYGSHTVLKGEGQKEVEREVRTIFDVSNLFTRCLVRFLCAMDLYFTFCLFPGRNFQSPTRNRGPSKGYLDLGFRNEETRKRRNLVRDRGCEVHNTASTPYFGLSRTY